MTFEEFEKANPNRLRTEAQVCFDTANANPLWGGPPPLLQAQFYMMEIDRRNGAFSAEPMAGERHQQHEGRRAHRWGQRVRLSESLGWINGPPARVRWMSTPNVPEGVAAIKSGVNVLIEYPPLGHQQCQQDNHPLKVRTGSR
jgi:hypothetical protein